MRKVIAIAKAAGAALLLVAGTHAAAAEYPTKPIRIVVPYPAGGGTDMLGRAVAEKLTRRLSTQVIVDNRPGAGTNIGIGLVANGTPMTKLHAEIAGSLKSPDVVQRFKSEGADIVANKPEEFAAFLKDERVKWAKVVKQSGAKVD